ncbi:MAG: hypothetical protein M0P76_01245 [Candidatus Pacebacteria bacterium]|nr:hypothetical protein [Candidatus Paceibacterota bacterium]
MQNLKVPTSIITVGKIREPETISSILNGFNASYSDYSLIKINGKKVKRDFRIAYGGDVIALFKKEK